MGRQSGAVRLARDIAAAITSSVRIDPDMDVLDFGCGTGLVTLALRPLAGTVTGMDSSPGMLGALEGKIAAAGISSMRTVIHDAEADGPIPGRYHLIVSSMAMHHVKNVAPLLKKFHAALNPGGFLCIADLDSDGGLFHPDNTGVFHYGFSRDDMRAMFNAAGFQEVRDSTAAEVARPLPAGTMRNFTVFLITGKR